MPAQHDDLVRLIGAGNLGHCVVTGFALGVDLVHNLKLQSHVFAIGQQPLDAAEIVVAPGAYQYDYRVDLEAVAMRPASLPSEVERALLDLMDRLQLVYGAIDLRRTSQGEHVFLEINPAGEFLFVEERCGLPLAAAMANLLTRLDREQAPA